MIILALDTSSMVASVALMDENKLMGEYSINHKRTHSQKILPIIKSLLESCETTMKQIGAIAVAEGPGSFTGLRIGVATAKGLAHAVNIPVIGINTLDAMAFNVPFCNGLVCPILDARRNQVYTGLYKWDVGGLNSILPPRAVSIDLLINDLLERPEEVVFMGDGIGKNKDILQESLKERVKFAPFSVEMPRAASVAELALQEAGRGKLNSFYEIEPVYLRKSEAERQYEEKTKRFGRGEHGKHKGTKDD